MTDDQSSTDNAQGPNEEDLVRRGLIAPGARLERVATGAVWAEGPVWVPESRSVRFSDVRTNRILQFSEASGELSVFDDDPEFTNGRTLDRDGAIVECSHGRRAVQRRRGDTVEILAAEYAGARLNSPNDVVVASDGSIWFTDPAYGIEKDDEGHAGEREYGDLWVFRLDGPTGSLRPVVTDVEAPNGLAFSPDESLLYVSDTSGSPRPGAGHHIRVYDVVDGRLAKNGRLFAEVDPGAPDGFRVDVAGNLWSSSGDGVQVFSPTGERIGHIGVPEVVANLCFGGDDGRTLYVAATTSLYRIATTTTDAAAARRPVPGRAAAASQP